MARGRRLLPGHHIHESAVKYLSAPRSRFDNTAAEFFDLESGLWLPVQNHLNFFQVEQDAHSQFVKEIAEGLQHTENAHPPLSESLVDTLLRLLSLREPVLSISDYSTSFPHADIAHSCWATGTC